MALVRCENCGVETPDRRDHCYHCHKPWAVRVEVEKPPQPPASAPVDAQKRLPPPPLVPPSTADPYATGMKVLGVSLVVYALVVGLKIGTLWGLGMGVAMALGFGLLAFMAGLALAGLWEWLGGKPGDGAGPLIAAALIGVLTVLGLVGGFHSTGSDDCQDAGRYNEYSTC